MVNRRRIGGGGGVGDGGGGMGDVKSRGAGRVEVLACRCHET